MFVRMPCCFRASHLMRTVCHAVVVPAVFSLASPAAWGDAAELVSVGLDTVAPQGASSGVAISRDGNVVGFYSDAFRLVAGDTNEARDVFVRDLTTGNIERVSVSSAGIQANLGSHQAGGPPALSDDGSVVAFYSDATNLVPGAVNGRRNVFVRHRDSGITELVSSSVTGGSANGDSLMPSISADGRFVAFQSSATNLVDSDTNHASDIFVRDLVLGETVRACGVQPDGFSFSPALSANGRVVAFASAATNLVSGDGNGFVDIYTCDLDSGVIERVSVGPGGVEGDGDSILPAISADGRIVAFKSLATNLVANDHNGLVDVFAHDRLTGVTERISVTRRGGDPDDLSFPPSVSADGRFVAFGSFASNLIQFDLTDAADVFVRDRAIGVTLVVGRNATGEQANRGTPDIPPAISADGTRIAFVSYATNLSNRDTNNAADIYYATNPFFGPGSCPNGDEDCSDGQVCVEGFCVDPIATRTPTPTPTSTRTLTPTPTWTPTPTFQPCDTDDDCPDGKICRGGFCREPRPCDPEDPAVELLMCFDRETCIDNLCECGGDCNRDGYVLGTEITRAILVLAGQRDLSECQAADIDLDGAVMGNEITLAIINLNEGCIQEGRPLIFAHDRGDTIALHIDSTILPSGRAAEVGVSIGGGSGEVATVQLDLLFDPTVLRLHDPAGSCRKDPRLSDHVIVAATPNHPPAPPGMERVRLFIGSIAAPIRTMSDGPVASCVFELLPSIPGDAVAIAPDRLNIGDDRGSIFRISTSDGSIELPIFESTPVPVPQLRCAGDCDGDGAVLGSEVTRAVRIMIGDLPLASCPAADANGDGSVFVTDITQAVIHLGLGCPE